jgi:hypothetical protein
MYFRNHELDLQIRDDGCYCASKPTITLSGDLDSRVISAERTYSTLDCQVNMAVDEDSKHLNTDLDQGPDFEERIVHPKA